MTTDFYKTGNKYILEVLNEDTNEKKNYVGTLLTNEENYLAFIGVKPQRQISNTIHAEFFFENTDNASLNLLLSFSNIFFISQEPCNPSVGRN
jgi:hypothetical protein